MENCYILGYKGLNENYEDFPERERNLISMARVSDLEDEPVTRGSLYNFIVLNSPVTGQVGKRIINTKW